MRKGATATEVKTHAATAACQALHDRVQADYGAEVASDPDRSFNRVWRAARGPNTRPSHAAADGQIVGLTQPFSVGGENLMTPCDLTNGSPANVYNCCCHVEYQQLRLNPQTGLFEPEAVTRGANAILTDDEIASIIFNESRSLSGSEIDLAREAIAHAVMNGDERFGISRPDTAGKSVNLTSISNAEATILNHIKTVIVPNVKLQRSQGFDAAGGNNYFNFRDATDLKFPNGEIDVRTQEKRFKNGFLQPVYTSFGPFYNSFPNPADGLYSTDQAYLVIFFGKHRVVK